MSINYEKWVKTALDGKNFSREDAVTILEDSGVDILHLAAAAGEVRMATFGKKVMIHQINNIQNGLCPEDCGYCGQSKISKAPLNKYAMKDEDEIVREAHEAKSRGVYRYCMVASGRGPGDRTTAKLAKVIRRINEEVGIKTCLSAGIVNESQAKTLKEAGLDRLNHNLNTSEAHTPNVVSTHGYSDRLETLRAAKQAGLDTCSGIIVGMGESNYDILDVAYSLRDMEVPSIPVNFLIPIPGNPLYDFDQLTPQRCLRILCAFRFISPKSEIRMAGGREGHLRGLQTLALYPANSLFVEGYLVTRGDKANKVFQMIYDAGFEPESDDGSSLELSPSGEFMLDDNPDIMNPKTTSGGG
ncbi:MAG: biotin synthase BioB [Deltaproteobacteria bacterium]|nr:biotin synthase BioB [Deltaproteobacteria bacterium]